MTRDKGKENDNCGSLCLSSKTTTTSSKTISARRKMWGEDGNGARRIKLPPFY
jgi:hypothetical protein